VSSHALHGSKQSSQLSFCDVDHHQQAAAVRAAKGRTANESAPTGPTTAWHSEGSLGWPFPVLKINTFFK